MREKNSKEITSKRKNKNGYYKVIFLIIISATVGFLIAHFWMSNINFNVAAIASIAALMTALINGLMFLNQRKEFKKSFEPLLVPMFSNEGFEYEFKEGKRIPHSINWLNPKEGRTNEINEFTDKNHPYIPIKNIGRGTATDIKADLEIVDYENIIKILDERYDNYNRKMNEYGRKARYRLNMKNSEDSSDEKLLFVRYRMGAAHSIHSIGMKLNYIETQEFISLPEKSESIFKLRMPAAFLVLANLCAYINADDLLPALKLKLTAKNLLGEEVDLFYNVVIDGYNEKNKLEPGGRPDLEDETIIKYNWELKAKQL